MSSKQRRGMRLSLTNALWILISAFTLILILFGVRLNDIHQSILNSNELPSDQDSSSIHSLRHLKSVKDESCQWSPPYDELQSYAQFDKYFENLSFDIEESIAFIANLTNTNCRAFEQGYIYSFDGEQKESDLNIAIATIIILPKNITKVSVFSDVRTYIFALSNALIYAQLHGYSLIVQTERIFKYEVVENETYSEWMEGATFQKPFLISAFLSDFDWLLWIDADTLFLNCRRRIEDVIEFAHFTHPTQIETLSLIFGAEKFATMNAGVWTIKSNEWSKQLIADWIFIEENAEKFEIMKADNVHRDQPLFVALLQGFDARKKITKKTWKKLKFHNELAQKKYLTKELKLDFDQMVKRPIWDDEMAKYAVAIDEAVINGKTTHFRMDPAQIFIAHFYWTLKYRTKTVFKMMQYSTKRCRI